MTKPWPYFAEDEIQAAVQCLQSGKVNYWTGTKGREFEAAFAAYCGVKHAVAVANGTVAIEVALHAIGLQPGEEVITTSRTFLGTTSAIVVRGGIPVFVDVNPNTQNIDAAAIEAAITFKTKAIIPVHLAGLPCEMDKIMAIAEKHGLYVIEDCAQAHGAVYKNKKVGSWGHVNAFSFCQDKIMTTAGEGGMVTTNDSTLWEKVWSYKDHGKSYSKAHAKPTAPGFRWLHDDFGTNWRLTEMQSAIGIQQLNKLDQWVAQRAANAAVYTRYFSQHPLIRPLQYSADYQNAFYKYYVFVRPEQLKPEWSRDRIMQEIGALGVPCFSGSCSEIYLEECFSKHGLAQKKRLPCAKELGETSLMFLVHPTLTEQDIAQYCEKIVAIFDEACVSCCAEREVADAV